MIKVSIIETWHISSRNPEAAEILLRTEPATTSRNGDEISRTWFEGHYGDGLRLGEGNGGVSLKELNGLCAADCIEILAERIGELHEMPEKSQSSETDKMNLGEILAKCYEHPEATVHVS